ncbi:MFS transporter [Streptomyces stelliscabiei]|uniref:MFS transporter n=1 Tax=Streptomyces stelliscabiei TaxID=146820 RepID=UPI0029B80792|nr:MFS transporter [Streptomyces stelliscabiei]MDX3435700.1 MFS transporter [Streptomyces stelliscabiei]MDX3622001.1 MFS transporter [Streptomyces stelliscabiei]
MTLLDGARASRGRPLPVVRYRDVLRVPCATQLLGGALIGRLPTGMAPLAILLSADGAGEGSSAGLLAAVYLVANAIGGPLSARLVDHYGPRHVLPVGALLSSTAFLALAAGPAEIWWAVAAVTAAGAARPPLDAALRTLWGVRGMMPSPAHQRVALALDSGTQELIYIVGPMLVATIVATTSASWALVATAAVGALGTVLFVGTPVSRAHHAFKSQSAQPDWLGPIRSARLRVLYAAMTCVGVTIGALTPLAVDAADRFDAPELSGGLPAAVSCGAVLGGLAYGARAWRGGTASHLIVLSVVFAAGWIPLTVAGSPTTALSAAAIPGLAMAPLLGAGFVTTSAFAPPGHTTEAHALLVAFLDIGCAIGTAAAGVTHTQALLPAGAAAAALILATTRRRLTPACPHALPAMPDPEAKKEPHL